MDFIMILKGGFIGFVLSLGMQLLCFYMARFFSGISKEHFVAVFIAAGLASATSVCAFLLPEIRASATPEFTFLLLGCVGGWLLGILLGLTYAKPLLIRLWK